MWVLLYLVRNDQRYNLYMDSTTLAQTIGKLLLARGLTLVTAESCTGGLVGHWITNIPGSSAYYLGGVVSYSNGLKTGIVGVNPNTIEEHGAVSEQTALEMAVGVRKKLGADIGVSVTGIAGPGGATESKPVGLTWIGLSGHTGDICRRYIWDRDRIGNKDESARAVLRLLVEYLER